MNHYISDVFLHQRECAAQRPGGLVPLATLIVLIAETP
jgi:hypothetical protein